LAVLEGKECKPSFDKEDKKSSWKWVKHQEDDMVEDQDDIDPKVRFDPDGDGFYISDEDAIKIHNRI